MPVGERCNYERRIYQVRTRTHVCTSAGIYWSPQATTLEPSPLRSEPRQAQVWRGFFVPAFRELARKGGRKRDGGKFPTSSSSLCLYNLN